MEHSATTGHEPWNKGKLVGQNSPLKLKDIWAVRIRLQIANRIRDLSSRRTTSFPAGCASRRIHPWAAVSAMCRALHEGHTPAVVRFRSRLGEVVDTSPLTRAKCGDAQCALARRDGSDVVKPKHCSPLYKTSFTNPASINTGDTA